MKMIIGKQFALLLLCKATSTAVLAFSISLPFCPSKCTTSFLLSSTKSPVPEYNVEDDEIHDNTAFTSSDSLPENLSEPPLDFDALEALLPQHQQQQQQQYAEHLSSRLPITATAVATTKPLYAAMLPGTLVQIQTGNVTLSRKAWKKRRRSGSPLLVPCSILSVDKLSTVRWNLIYLLQKFGSTAAGTSGIEIALPDLIKRHRTHLKSSLTKLAIEMGFDTPASLLKSLFPKQIEDTYGVKLLVREEEEDDQDSFLALQAPLSRFKAQQRAKEAAILQVTFGPEDLLLHTGLVRNRRLTTTTATTATTTTTTASQDDEQDETENLYQLGPLGAALRVSQEEVESGVIQNGSMHAAIVFDYDPTGDAGAPLLTLSLNPSRNQVRERLKLDRKYESTTLEHPTFMLKELKIGQGPMRGKVIKLIKGGALVDCNIGRHVRETTVRVNGFLGFRDAVVASTKPPQASLMTDSALQEEDDDDDEDWNEIFSIDDLNTMDDDDDDDEASEYDDDDDDEEEFSLSDLINEENDESSDTEDITHLFKIEQDGSLTYTDPESGERTKVVSSADDDDDDEFDDDEEVEETLPRKRKGPIAGPTLFETTTVIDRPLKSKRLHVGDTVQVYVKSISKQTNQLLLTMDSTIQGKKAKDIKKENEFNKKLTRLSKQLGGLYKVQALIGKEYGGTVKATSHTGDWLYVQPDEADLPVGVATLDDTIGNSYNKGDAVRIRIDGVDEERGQLAMTVLGKP